MLLLLPTPEKGDFEKLQSEPESERELKPCSAIRHLLTDVGQLAVLERVLLTGVGLVPAGEERADEVVAPVPCLTGGAGIPLRVRDRTHRVAPGVVDLHGRDPRTELARVVLVHCLREQVLPEGAELAGVE